MRKRLSNSRLMHIQTIYVFANYSQDLNFWNDFLFGNFGFTIKPPKFPSRLLAGGQFLGSADPPRAAESRNQRLRPAAGLGPASQRHGLWLDKGWFRAMSVPATP